MHLLHHFLSERSTVSVPSVFKQFQGFNKHELSLPCAWLSYGKQVVISSIVRWLLDNCSLWNTHTHTHTHTHKHTPLYTGFLHTVHIHVNMHQHHTQNRWVPYVKIFRGNFQRKYQDLQVNGMIYSQMSWYNYIIIVSWDLASFPGLHPVSCCLQYGKMGEGLVHFITWVTSRVERL